MRSNPDDSRGLAVLPHLPVFEEEVHASRGPVHAAVAGPETTWTPDCASKLGKQLVQVVE